MTVLFITTEFIVYIVKTNVYSGNWMGLYITNTRVITNKYYYSRYVFAFITIVLHCWVVFLQHLFPMKDTYDKSLWIIIVGPKNVFSFTYAKKLCIVTLVN